jgi:hypothetical protein
MHHFDVEDGDEDLSLLLSTARRGTMVILFVCFSTPPAARRAAGTIQHYARDYDTN